MDYPLIVRTSFDIEYRCTGIICIYKKKKNYTRKNKKYRTMTFYNCNVSITSIVLHEIKSSPPKTRVFKLTTPQIGSMNL